MAALGWAQAVIDFILWIHFMAPVYVIEAFGAGRWIILVAVTAAIGYVVGPAFGPLWNRLHADEIQLVPELVDMRQEPTAPLVVR